MNGMLVGSSVVIGKQSGVPENIPKKPPITDIGGMHFYKASFNDVHTRYLEGGWAREVTQYDFAMSEDIAGVNMRLDANAIREMHWHQQAEWGFVLDGTCRITILDEQGRPQVSDVEAGNVWYFPPGLPHSLQGLGPSGTEFILAFDNGQASEFNTLLLTDFVAHIPLDVLALNFNVDEQAFVNIPKHNLYIFPAADPGPLDIAQQSVLTSLGSPENSFIFDINNMEPTLKTKSGFVKVVDSRNFKASKTIAASVVTVHPGGMRELHWHPNADEWQYYVKGQGQVTVFNTGPQAETLDFKAGDIGYVKKSFGHYVKNTSDTDLVFLEVFKADHFVEVSLSDWLTHTPPQMVMETLNISAQTLVQFPKDRPDVVPE